MPPQHVEIAETIAALRRTLRREREAPTDQPISSATNRGNKLKRGANYVHAGALPYLHGPDGYKQKIEHAGYSRYILDYNPKRYNEYGDELEDSESDAEADADAEDENPYSNVRIEELLCPLKHPSDLARHPTLSLPFLDSALPDMVKSTEDKLRQERVNLWRAKNLSRQFMGDESWMPCGRMEVNDDWDMFEPKPRSTTPCASKKRKRNTENEAAPNGINGHDYSDVGENGLAMQDAVDAQLSNPEEQAESHSKKTGKSERELETETELGATDGVDVTERGPATTNGVHTNEDAHTSQGEPGEKKAKENNALESKSGAPESMEVDTEGHGNDGASEDDTEQPQPTRRITRSLAAEHNSSNAPTPLSRRSTNSSIDSSLLQADPLFLLPPSLAANHRAPRNLSRLGLPVEEFIETRRLLMMFIQKQEESVRGYEAVLAKLIKAKRMRDNVWDWCKTEGHVGEWSDGEDWIDAEAWGLAPDELKKGKDEEEVEGAEETGRKGKRRRRD
ncbi:uncharacterized protein Z518_02737 [Rhinocladiella mackenziei CBS 650.93]|uniref:Transcriptional regulatory protein RXT2 N-terminal domain-containing protein n=1 Tax=Rhinocladiella mackenziei CBS 650.93 TaxID=1442369 RepID=A0A0D2G0Q1_9EURO|nr:uncharacterized protein Z518_02737 [Rhinocladiella mackenziei CBS 650.93]KIX08082.1 hypothetical protein Z518_02737 [Rhinocladiella mackenziei CBS 650.93]